MKLIESKSLLAKLMATENLTVEQRNVSTASFDVKNRVLTVPTLDNNISPDLYDLFMGHEVGHALYTPLDGMMDAIDRKMNMSVINVVEDCRIERKTKYKYPGLKTSFLKGYKELIDRDFFETKNKNLNEMNFIDRLNLFCKGGVQLNIKFNETEKSLIKDVESTETYADVLEVSQKIVDYMEMINEELQQKQKIFVQSDDPEDDDYEEIEYDDEGYPKEEEESNDWEDEYGNREDNIENYETHASVGGSGQQEIRSYTDEAYRRNERQLFADKGTEYLYVNIPKVNIEEVILDYKVLYKRYSNDNLPVSRDQFNQYRRESNKVVSYLVKEFEMRKNADQMKRASTAKTGELNMNKIFSYNFSEDIFKKITVVPGGKSHGLVMFLDWSGSMAHHIENTIKQLFNLVLFCKKVNIPFEVYCFTDCDDGICYKHAYKNGDIILHPFKLMNILSSRMSANEFTFAGGALLAMVGSPSGWNLPYWFRMCGTPLNETLIAAMEIIPAFQKKYKLQVVNTVVLSDGDGTYLGSHVVDGREKDMRYVQLPNGDYKKVTDVIFVDPITKFEVKYRSHYNDSFKQTNALVRMFKNRTKSNAIGFYVTSSREFKQKLYMFYPEGLSGEKFEQITTQFRKEKFSVSTATDFDDYYILRSNGLNTEEDAELVVRENATTRGLVSAFTKYTGARVNNRVILNRFIGLIS